MLVGTMVVLILLGGCLSATVEITVDRDGSLDLDQQVTYWPELAELMRDTPDWDGPEPLAAELAEDLEAAGWSNVAYEADELDDGSIWIRITSTDTDPAQVEEVSVTFEDDLITFILREDPFFDDDLPNEDFFDEDEQSFAAMDDDDDDFFNDEFDEFLDDIDVRYIVNMPGSITATNGEQIDDTSVEWTLAYLIEHDLDQMEVTSTLDGEDTTPTPDDDDADGIPGFGLVLGVLALLSVAYLVYRSR